MKSVEEESSNRRVEGRGDGGMVVEKFVGDGVATFQRVIFFGTVTGLDLVATLWMADWFWQTGLHRAHLPLLVLFFLLNGMVTFGGMSALFGALASMGVFGKPRRIMELADGVEGPLRARYAIAIPVYEEDAGKVCARVEAMYRSLEREGQIGAFDFYILSDTRNGDAWVIEEVAWASLCRRLGGFGKIFYRRRKKNENRKAGNIADFVRTVGGRYDSMLVLDADSLMDGREIVRMARVMEAYPRLGILQSPPRLVRGQSAFSRAQQFAMAICSPLFVRGLNFWQLGQGSYWGHNAMIRIRPFSEFCDLPALPGKEPFGGRIFSHDFVEAALMVRAGWEVWLAWDVELTFEESPPTLVEHLKRDRRWCQGNLQHIWLLLAKKLPLPVRMHLFMGVMAYLGSPLWFLFLFFSMWLAWDWKYSGLSELPFRSLVERWLGVDSDLQVGMLFGWVLGMIFLPKVLGLVRVLRHRRFRERFGGGWSVIRSAVLEIIISVLLAPVMMVAHTGMVVSLLMGRVVGWPPQTRETDGTPWGDAVRVLYPALVLGGMCLWVSLQIGGYFPIWMSPIWIGLLLSVPLSVWTSRVSVGRWLRDRGIFLTPEEVEVPEVLRWVEGGGASGDGVLDAQHGERMGAVAAVVDPYVNAVHVSLLEPEEGAGDLELVKKSLERGLRGLGRDELERLLQSGATMLALHRAVWLSDAQGMDGTWRRALESYRAKMAGK